MKFNEVDRFHARSPPARPSLPGGSLPVAAGVLPTLPLFSPATAPARGLDLLAAAAAADKPDPVVPLVGKPGPFDPAASLAPKVVKNIFDLEFVKMAELTVDDATPQVPSRPAPPARLPITDRYSLMAAVLCSKFPEKARELFAYEGK